MRKFTNYLIAVAALFMGVCMAACTEDPNTQKPDDGEQEQPVTPVEASVEVEVVQVTPAGALIEVTTTNIKEFAYLRTDNEIPESGLFVGGTVKTIAKPESETVTRVELMGIDENTPTTVLFAFRKSNEEFYGEVVKAEFTTLSYDGALTVVDRRLDGFAVHIKVPEDVKQRGNALRFSSSSLPMYNYKKSQGGLELDMLLYNAGQYTLEDRTVRYDSYNSYERDENGNIVNDGASYADPKVPGEPGVFLVGEFSFMDNTEEVVVYMDLTDDGVDNPTATVVEALPEDPLYFDYLDAAIWWYPAGWNPGYYMPFYDWDAFVNGMRNDPNFDTESCWLGFYDRIQVDTLEPETFDGGVKIGVHSLKPIDGCVTFEATDNVSFYNVMIMEESEYQNVVLPLLDNNPDYLRWFTGSYFAMYTFGSMSVTEQNTEIYLSDWFIDMRTMQGKDVHVLCSAMGDNEGKTQVYQDFTFQIPNISKDAPVVVVTPVESDDPYTATFNIKAPNKDVYEAYFACDYVREFDTALKGTTYLALMREIAGETDPAKNPNKLGVNEVAQINSDAGLNLSLDSREDATTRLAIIVYNDEGTHNNDLNNPDSQAIAECTTPKADYPTRENHEFFDVLCGEWVASAQMDDYNSETGKWTPMGKTFTSDVTIAAGIEYPETLPQEVYNLYQSMGVSRDATDALYEEFVALAENYNSRTRGFNRLLCLGYNLTDKEYMLDLVATPYDLFTMKDYSASQVSHMFYDFGPKWNLEIDNNGNICLPVNIAREFPMCTWNFGMEYTFYLLAVTDASYLGAPVYGENGALIFDPRFPVEVSDDRNTLTIKPLEYKYKTEDGALATAVYYPCVAQLSYGMATPTAPRVGSEVVLTRKSSVSAAQKNASVGKKSTPKVKSIGDAPVPMERRHGITPVRAIKVKEFTRVVPKQKIETGYDAFARRADELYEKTYGIK